MTKHRMFLEHGDKNYSTAEVMEKILEIFTKTSAVTEEKIAEQTGFPVPIIKSGIKELEKAGKLRILDTKKNPIEVLVALGASPIDNENRSKKIN